MSVSEAFLEICRISMTDPIVQKCLQKSSIIDIFQCFKYTFESDHNNLYFTFF